MIAALGCLAATLSIAVVWPQVWRSCRHRRTLGLSPTSAWLAVGLNVCWLTFGALTGDPAQMITNAVVGIGNTAVLAALLLTQPHLRTRRNLLRSAAGAAGLVALAVGSVLGVTVLGAHPAAVATTLSSVLALVGAAAALSQPLSLLRDRTQDMSGLSRARWRLGAGSCASWTSYGWLGHQPAVSLGAGFGLTCALLMCSLLGGRTAQPAGPRRPVRPAVRTIPEPRVPARPALVAA
jgi:uncharacterized protein with PQ loop repeat